MVNDGTLPTLLAVGALAAAAVARTARGSSAEVPFYERTLDSFSDEVITRTLAPDLARDPHAVWYAVLDVGPKKYVSDPDFASAAKTREGAIAKAARAIRDNAAGLGKQRTYDLLKPGSYDLEFRLMKHWTEKEAKGSAARGMGATCGELRAALLVAPNPPTNYALTEDDVRLIAAMYDWEGRWVESGWSPGTKEYASLPAMIRAEPQEFLADISRYYGDDYYLPVGSRRRAAGSPAKADAGIAALWRLGRPARAGNLWTDGQTIWSYDLAIGETRDGQKVAINHKVSHTTGKHLKEVKAVADTVEEPARYLPKGYFKIPRITGPRGGGNVRGGSAASVPDVARAWAAGRPLRASSLRTDGLTLWSYSLIIGETVGGEKVLYDYRGRNAKTVTTSGHVTRAQPYADRVTNPAYRDIPRITGRAPAQPQEPARPPKRVAPGATAREIIRAHWGDSPNFMTPDRIATYKVPDGAAELSSGSGFDGDTIYGVSVVRVGPDGATTRDNTASQVFQALGEAKEHLRELGARVR